jgi:ABC-type nitrate/sulfonate/bicarbonate transport system ATPase subunit
MQAPKMREFFEVMDTLPQVRDKPSATEATRLTGQVSFRDVSFSYDGKRPAVLDVSFDVQPGETIAIVGSTGSGKSTTLGLLHRAFDPQSGGISADGIDLRDYTLGSLRRNIGVVFQEPMLFARTIRENLLVGKPDASEEEMRAALDRARPGIAFYLAGVDVVAGDRFGRLSMTRAGLRARDRLVLRSLGERGIPTVLLLSGGYAATPELTADLHAEAQRRDGGEAGRGGRAGARWGEPSCRRRAHRPQPCRPAAPRPPHPRCA